MTSHKTVTREEWLAARLELLEAEKELTRRGDELARRRQELPWVRVEKDYRFETGEGSASLADLFAGRSQLLAYHFMFGPDYSAGCPSCSAIADGFNGFVVHLANHDVTLCAVSRAPLDKIQAYRQRMGWSFSWAATSSIDFNLDFQVSSTPEQQQAGAGEYNFRPLDMRASLEVGKEGPLADWAATCGTDWPTYARERPGLSAFALDDGTVYRTALAAAYAATVRSLIAVITALNEQVKILQGQVEEHFGRHPDAEVYLSQPGMGAIPGARVLAEFGDDPHRYRDGKARRNYAATSPITRASGKKKVVVARFVHNDRLTGALNAQAFAALSASPGARAFYDQQRAAGHGHNDALRRLANRLAGILHGCLKTGTLYNEATAWGHRLGPPPANPASRLTS